MYENVKLLLKLEHDGLSIPAMHTYINLFIPIAQNQHVLTYYYFQSRLTVEIPF